VPQPPPAPALRRRVRPLPPPLPRSSSSSSCPVLVLELLPGSTAPGRLPLIVRIRQELARPGRRPAPIGSDPTRPAPASSLEATWIRPVPPLVRPLEASRPAPPAAAPDAPGLPRLHLRPPPTPPVFLGSTCGRPRRPRWSARPRSSSAPGRPRCPRWSSLICSSACSSLARSAGNWLLGCRSTRSGCPCPQSAALLP
jgi:hypothetical protein